MCLTTAVTEASLNPTTSQEILEDALTRQQIGRDGRQDAGISNSNSASSPFIAMKHQLQVKPKGKIFPQQISEVFLLLFCFVLKPGLV